MNILFGISPEDGWARAANYIGHNGFTLDSNKPFESFGLSKPDLLIISRNNTNNIPIIRAIDKYCPKLLVLDEIPIAADCPPDFSGGEIKEEYVSEASIVCGYNPNYDKYLLEMINSSINFKVFGHKGWTIPQYLGYIKPSEIANVFTSANCVLDLEGDINRVMAIYAAGGIPLSVGNWSNIDFLSDCIQIKNEKELPNLIRSLPKEKLRKKIPTLADELSKILENIV